MIPQEISIAAYMLNRTAWSMYISGRFNLQDFARESDGVSWAGQMNGFFEIYLRNKLLQ